MSDKRMTKEWYCPGCNHILDNLEISDESDCLIAACNNTECKDVSFVHIYPEQKLEDSFPKEEKDGA